MATNTNKRLAVKWVRDRAKKAYEKDSCCYICGSQVDLELHHTHSITLLLDRWAAEHNYDISTDEGILEVRDEFIETHRKELYDEVFTLCNKHHIALHNVYGKIPQPGSEPKQHRWIDIQKQKANGTQPTQSSSSFFTSILKKQGV